MRKNSQQKLYEKRDIYIIIKILYLKKRYKGSWKGQKPVSKYSVFSEPPTIGGSEKTAICMGANTGNRIPVFGC